MEHIGTAATKAVRGTVRARKDSSKQEKEIKLGVIKDRLGELKTLKQRMKDAGADYSSAIKKAAEDSGLNSSAVRAFVDAASGNNLEDRRRNAEQLQLLFDEVKA